MSKNFDRRCLISLSGSSSLTVPGGAPGDLKIDFSVGASTVQTPNEGKVRIYNPNPQTIAAFKGKEFQKIEIQAGYVGNMGVVYRGDIQQSLFAHAENVVDSYVDVFAATAQNAYQQATVNNTLSAGHTPMDRANLALSKMMPLGVTGWGVLNVDLTKPVYPRGSPFFGMARNILRDVAIAAGATWWLDMDGRCNMVDHRQAVSTGGPIVLNSATGLIGFPHITEGGIVARCLINPAIQAGTTAVKINEADIIGAERDNSVAGGFGTVGDKNKALDMAGKTAADGIYRVVFLEIEASTRDLPYYMTLTCIAIGGALNDSESLTQKPISARVAGCRTGWRPE